MITFVVDRIAKFIREQGEYQVRDYKTIGGMWTVDTWTYELDGEIIYARLQDEGYTWNIKTDTLNVFQSGNAPITYTQGSEEMLIDLATRLGL